jgi:hypothetical protein
MATITGRIFDIVVIKDNIAQIVLRKKCMDKIVPLAITVYGFWKDKAIKELQLKAKDMIRGNLYMRSRLHNGKYYTDLFFREIFVVERAPIKMNELFHKEPNIEEDLGDVDMETGEILSRE